MDAPTSPLLFMIPVLISFYELLCDTLTHVLRAYWRPTSSAAVFVWGVNWFRAARRIEHRKWSHGQAAFFHARPTVLCIAGENVSFATGSLPIPTAYAGSWWICAHQLFNAKLFLLIYCVLIQLSILIFRWIQEAKSHQRNIANTWSFSMECMCYIHGSILPGQTCGFWTAGMTFNFHSGGQTSKWTSQLFLSMM